LACAGLSSYEGVGAMLRYAITAPRAPRCVSCTPCAASNGALGDARGGIQLHADGGGVACAVSVDEGLPPASPRQWTAISRRLLEHYKPVRPLPCPHSSYPSVIAPAAALPSLPALPRHHHRAPNASARSRLLYLHAHARVHAQAVVSAKCVRNCNSFPAIYISTSPSPEPAR
jgi:hypothetical protein